MKFPGSSWISMGFLIISGEIIRQLIRSNLDNIVIEIWRQSLKKFQEISHLLWIIRKKHVQNRCDDSKMCETCSKLDINICNNMRSELNVNFEKNSNIKLKPSLLVLIMCVICDRNLKTIPKARIKGTNNLKVTPFTEFYQKHYK